MYAALYESWLRENEEKELQPLPKDFYAQVSVYRNGLREKLKTSDEKSLETRLLRLEDEKSGYLLRELMSLRLRKVVNLSLENKTIKVADLTVEEEKLYLQIKNVAEDAKRMLDVALQGVPLEKPCDIDLERRWIIRFLKETPAIVGADMKVYGPFEAEDVASLPPQNAEGLIKHGVCKRIDAP